MPSFTFTGEVTLSFSTKDRKAAADWYARRLGFTLMYDAPEIGWCEMQTPLPGVTAGFGENTAVQPGGCVPVFSVVDIAAARSELEGAGVRFDGPTQTIPDLVMLATFFDPDGNAWMLAQSLAPGR